MSLKRGDIVKLKNTSRADQHWTGSGMVPMGNPDGTFDGLQAVILEGPYTKASSGDIQLYRILINDPSIDPHIYEAEATWSALDKIGEGGEDQIELHEAIRKWERQLND